MQEAHIEPTLQDSKTNELISQPTGSSVDPGDLPDQVGIDATIASVEQAVTNSAENPAPSSSAVAPYPWILHPVIDVLFCCGVFPVIMYFITLMGFRNDPFNVPAGTAMWALTIIGIHCFQDAHGIATWHRIFTHKETMDSMKRYFIIITIVAAVMFVPLLKNEWLLINCLRLYLLLGLQHWLMQSYGVTLIYFFKRGYMLDPWERRLVLLVFQSIMWFTWVRFFTIPSYGSIYLNTFQVPFVGPLPMWMMNTALIVMQLVILAFAGMVVRKYVLQKKLVPFPALLLLSTTIWVFTMSENMFGLLMFFIGAFYHGSQSWCVTTSFHCKAKGLPDSIPYNSIWKIFLKKSTWLYFGLLFVVSELIYTVAPRMLAMSGISLGVAFAATVCVFSTHHFLCDSAVWKLKNPKVRALLIK